jgi:hypothetical protein
MPELPIVAGMCILILGCDVLAAGGVLLAANRDEDPARPSDPPRMLCERPRGGRDRRAGGTWLAVREGRAGVAEDDPARLDAAPERREMLERLGAVSGPGLPHAALFRAFAALRQAPYAPCTLLFAAPEACWLMAAAADAAPRCEPVPGGWHVITHADLDDAREPRTARLMRELAGFAPHSVAQAEQRLDALLRSHGDDASGIPPVCLHAGRMVTVSASSVWLAAGEARYRHAEGRPCEHVLADHSHLLRAPASAAERR